MIHEMQFSIKELRARKNMTQEQVAKALGISTQTYCAWEKDISNVAIGKVQAVADFFDVRIGQIFLPSYMKNNHVENLPEPPKEG